jgi:hypothetical protein
MLDFGLKKGFNWVRCTGKELTFEGVNVPEGFTEPLPEEVRTMMDYSILKLGVSFGKIGFWQANIKNYGMRESDRFVRYYADLLFLVDSKIDPIYNGVLLNDSYLPTAYTKYELDKSKRSKIGFCIGASTNNINKFSIMNQFGFELAYLPGIKGTFKSNFSFLIHSVISYSKLLN